MEKWWYLDTGWGCGGIKTKNNRIIETCPIFKKLKGQLLANLPLSYIIKPLDNGRKTSNHSKN